MNAVLWFVQIVLAIKLGSVAYMHGLRPDPTKMQRGLQRFGGATRPLLILISLSALTCSIALILPAALGVWTWLTPLSAALTALMMLAAIWFHIRCREKPKIPVELILAALAAFVAYGRWTAAPL